MWHSGVALWSGTLEWHSGVALWCALNLVYISLCSFSVIMKDVLVSEGTSWLQGVVCVSLQQSLHGCSLV